MPRIVQRLSFLVSSFVVGCSTIKPKLVVALLRRHRYQINDLVSRVCPVDLLCNAKGRREDDCSRKKEWGAGLLTRQILCAPCSQLTKSRVNLTLLQRVPAPTRLEFLLSVSEVVPVIVLSRSFYVLKRHTDLTPLSSLKPFEDSAKVS